jgi:hypothetical protein
MPVVRHDAIAQERQWEAGHCGCEQTDECLIVRVIEKQRGPEVAAVDDVMTFTLLKASRKSRHIESSGNTHARRLINESAAL